MCTDTDGKAEVEVDVVRLELDPNDAVNTHLQTSTAVLHDILHGGDRATSAYGYECPQCTKIYKTAGTLHTHRLLKHPESHTEAQCMACDKKYPSLMSLQNHVQYKHRYEHRCKVCYRSFESPELLDNHEQYCSKAAASCPACGKVYISQTALRNHMKYKHPERTDYYCHFCRRYFRSSRGLSNHASTVHLPGATVCNLCHRNFNSVAALQSHVLYKHTEDGARCACCHKVFATHMSLDRHLEKNHSARVKK